MQAVTAKMSLHLGAKIRNNSYNIYNNYNIWSKYGGTKLFLRKKTECGVLRARRN